MVKVNSVPFSNYNTTYLITGMLTVDLLLCFPPLLYCKQCTDFCLNVQFG